MNRAVIHIRGLVLVALAACLLLGAPTRGSAEPTTTKVRITGLFSPDREMDLRAFVEQWPDVKLVSVDYEHAEAVFRFDAAKLYPKATLDQVIAHLDAKLRSLPDSTFGIKPVSTTPRDKLKRIEIPVLGLDCKACCLAAYESVAKIDGVEQATASFKDGLITALIDPQKTDKAKLEAALKQRGVALKQP